MRGDFSQFCFTARRRTLVWPSSSVSIYLGVQNSLRPGGLDSKKSRVDNDVRISDVIIYKGKNLIHTHLIYRNSIASPTSLKSALYHHN